MPSYYLTTVICYLTGLSIVFAGRVNVTIDDAYGDERTGLPIEYTPADYWKAGHACTDSTAHPDPSRAYKSTWHDGTFNINNTKGIGVPVLQASVPFDGVAVYVYCILTGTYSSPDSYSWLHFVIDGEAVGEFVHQPNGDGTYYYNVPVYVNESVPAGNHSLQIVNGQAGGEKSLVLFDYIVYTRDTTSTPSLVSNSPQPISSPSQFISSFSQLTSSSSRLVPSLSSVTAPATTLTFSAGQAAATATAVPAPPSPSVPPPQAPVERDGGKSSNRNTVLTACMAAIFGSIVLCSIVGWAILYFRRRRRQRVAPSTVWLQSAAAREEMMAGGGPSAGPIIVTAEKSGRRGAGRALGRPDSPMTPVSVNTLAPLRPNSAENVGENAQRAVRDARGMAWGIDDVARTKAGWR